VPFTGQHDAEASLRHTQVRRRGGGIAGRALGVRERAKPYDKPDSARARVAKKPPEASNMMEMEEVSEDTAGAPATPGKQVAKQQVPLSEEEKEEILLTEWLNKLEREYKGDLRRWVELHKSDPEGHNRSGEDFWFPDRIKHKQWKRLAEFVRYVVLNLPLTVYITNNTNDIGKRVFAMDLMDMSQSNFDHDDKTYWRIMIKFERQKSN
jgi:hypothetical protein